MIKSAIIILIIVLFVIILPFTTSETSNAKTYEITSVIIKFNKTDAEFTVNYNMGELPKLYVLLIGSKNLEPKINTLFSNFDYKIIKMDEKRAVLIMKNVSRHDKDYYLHDSIKFGESIPIVYVYTPDFPRPKEFSNLEATPNIYYKAK